MKMDGIPSIGGLLDASFPRTRESRFGLRRISLDTAFAGMTEPRRLFVMHIIPSSIFSKEDTKSTKFEIEIIRTLRDLRVLLRKYM